MKSNGFGSFEQKIILRVNDSYSPQIERALQSEPFRKIVSGYSDFEWCTQSRKKGDDETVVYELGYTLTGIPDKAWKILWDESVY